MSFLDDVKLEKPDSGVHPLIHFKGDLVSIDEDLREFTRDGRVQQRKYVKFNFSNVEVIESREPYPLTDAVYSIAYQVREQTGKPMRNSRWAAWVESVIKVLPNPDIKLLIGKRQEWKEMPCKLQALNEETNKWEAVDSESMQVASVEGFNGDSGSGNSIFETLADMLVDSPDENSFYASVINDGGLRNTAGFSEVINMVTSRQLIPTLLVMELVAKDGDKYTRKTSE